MNPAMINNLNRKKKLVFCGGEMRSQSGLRRAGQQVFPELSADRLTFFRPPFTASR
jgi:hypothetical protein